MTDYSRLATEIFQQLNLSRVIQIVRRGSIDVFFFFQAEDGIRDLTVTGVQTCALPICALPPQHHGGRAALGGGAGHAAAPSGHGAARPRGVGAGKGARAARRRGRAGEAGVRRCAGGGAGPGATAARSRAGGATGRRSARFQIQGVSMTVRQAVGLIVSLLAAPLGRAAGQGQVVQKCEIRPGHQLVNSGVLYLKSANDTKFEDQRQKDLKDAYRVLTQAVMTGGQEKNPAAWYYLARYYAYQKDLGGADSAFTKAQELAPKCKDDIELWRRSLWVPVFNSGIQAWQAGNTDSAIASFRRADQIYTSEPTGFIYIASLLSGASQPDSAGEKFQPPPPHSDQSQVRQEERH